MGNTHLSGLEVAGVPTMGMSGLPLTTGSVYFVDPANGSDGYAGTADWPFATLYKGHDACVSGKNDVVVLVGNGAASGSARLSTALAQTITPAATAGTLNWTKSATHLIGACAPTIVAQRARIAPPSGTYTQATFGSGNFVVVTGSGCIFANLSLFNGFSTGGTNQICWTDNGSRNYYQNVNFGGIADAASAADTGSRSLKIGSGGSGENTFVNCVVGLDTVTRSDANASLELAGGTPRNSFIECVFPFQTSAAGVLGIIVSAAAGIDRWTNFERCMFVNNVQSTSTTMSGLATIAASAGGLLAMRNCTLVGITEFGTDATSRGQIYIDSATITAASSGIAVNPT